MTFGSKLTIWNTILDAMFLGGVLLVWMPIFRFSLESFLVVIVVSAAYRSNEIQTSQRGLSEKLVKILENQDEILSRLPAAEKPSDKPATPQT